MSKDSYTVFEYNTGTRKYKELASIEATSTREAREVYTQQTDWKPTSSTILFAKPPICR